MLSCDPISYLLRRRPTTAGITAGFALALLLASTLPSSAQLVISEFMAANRSTLLDEDGEPSDWIEIRNTSTEQVPAGGWFLTDDVSQPRLFVLPARTILPGEHWVVFASGKNRRPASPGKVHTNFRLDATGEYLALIRPDGVTIASEFSPQFPPQEADISYGTPTRAGSRNLLEGQPVTVLIPRSQADIAADWSAGGTATGAPWATTLGFGLGFDPTPPNPTAGTNLARAGTASQSTTGYGLAAANGNDGDLATFTHTATNDDASTWSLDLGGVYEVRRIILHNRPECCPSRFRDLTVTLLAPDGRTVLWNSGLLNPENNLDSPASIVLDLLELDVDPVPARIVRVSRTPDPDFSGGAGNADEDSVLSLGEVEVYGVDSIAFGPWIRTDVGAVLHTKNSSLLARIPFVLSSPESGRSLLLRLRYDDGVAVFLNGTRIASRNSPATLAWDSAALEDRSKADAVVPESIDLSAFLGSLRTGTNWLAFHALNRSANDPDFLLEADLTAESDAPVSASFLERPTPGAPNDVGSDLGRVADTRFSRARGFADAPFDLVIATDTSGAEIRYTLDGSIPTATHGMIYIAPIRLDRTTVVRAAAFRSHYRPTNVDTHTYIFPASTIAQPSRPAGFPANWAGLAPDYAMDPRITQAPAYAAQMTNALLALPTLSIATDVDNLFGPSRGIYSNPERTGLSWERPISMEWIDPTGAKVFQAGAGLRIQGGYFRNRSATHKHSFRLLFKDEYGPGRLRENLFEVFGATREFDTLVLRAGANDGYTWDAARDTEQYLRDEFGRRLHLAMGQTAAHGRFVHLYLNGLYWGLYNLTERPAEDFSASYLGGQPQDWDAINSGDVKNGSLNDWNTFIARVRTAATLADYQRLKGQRADGSRDPSAPEWLDAINYIDYMLLNIWGGNWDWPNKNFWFGRNRTGDSGGFKFYLWDFENTMGNNRDRSPLEMVSPRSGITSAWVAEPHDRLRRLDEYRVEFADRVHRHFFNGGVLSPESLVPHYRELARGIESAVIAESARWGDDHHATPQDLTDWQRERDWLLNTYLSRRTAVVLNQFRASGLYPQTPAPSFQPPRGPILPSTPVFLRAVGATELFYTTNGLDPRLPGGTIRPEAVRVPLQTGGPVSPTPPLNLVRQGHVWSYLADGTSPGSDWNQPSFNTSAWPTGPSPLGYGDGDEATVVPFVDSNPTTGGIQKNATTFFRTTFSVPNPLAYAQLQLTLTYDDAAAVYLNGTEVLRTDNLPAGTPFNAYASGASSDNAVLTSDSVPLSLLRSGNNVLAVEVRQSDGASSDISFDLSLTGVPTGQNESQSIGPLFFSSPTRIMARARNGAEWSALAETVLSPGAQPPSATQLVVSQFCYRPPEPLSAGERSVSINRDDFEFIEFLNVGTTTLDLGGVQLRGGVSWTFPPNTVLDPDRRILVVSRLDAFVARYGSGLAVAGEYQGRLGNAGDSFSVADAAGGTLHRIEYSDRAPWPALGNEGFALVLIAPRRLPDPSDPLNWRASASIGGTPGASDAAPFIGRPDVDTDANGQIDLFDHAFGIRLQDPAGQILVDVVEVQAALGPERHLVVSYPRRRVADSTPVTLDLADDIRGPWVRARNSDVTLVEEKPVFPSVSRVTYLLNSPIRQSSAVFVRLSVAVIP